MFRLCAVLAVFFTATFSFAGEVPSLWSIEYGPVQPDRVVNNSVQRFEERIVPNLPALESPEFRFQIHGINRVARGHTVEQNALVKSWFGYTDNSQFLSVITTDGVRTTMTFHLKEGGVNKMFIVTSRDGEHILSEFDAVEASKLKDDVIFPKHHPHSSLKIEELRKMRPSRKPCGEEYVLKMVYTYAKCALDYMKGSVQDLHAEIAHHHNLIQATIWNSGLNIRLEIHAIEAAFEYGQISSEMLQGMRLSERVKALDDSVFPTYMHFFGEADPGRPVGGSAYLRDRFSIVLLRQAWSTASHEWGHMGGGLHQPDLHDPYESDPSPWARAYNNNRIRTAVAYNSDRNGVPYCSIGYCEWLPIYSTPLKKFKGGDEYYSQFDGETVGVVGFQDNASVMEWVVQEFLGAEKRCIARMVDKLLVEKSVEHQ
jgi:hypothetical protein